MTYYYYGDTSGTAASGKLKGQTIRGVAIDELVIYGDAYTITGTAIGGRDEITVRGNGGIPIFVAGDADVISGTGLGGNDTITINGSGVDNFIYGDAQTLADHGMGGRDVIVSQASNGAYLLVGDASLIKDFASGGNDTITGNAASNTILGDAMVMNTGGRGGNDLIAFGVGVFAPAYGDAITLNAGTGGADTITGSESGTNFLYGDAFGIGSAAVCGNDRLVAGVRAVNLIYGDCEDLAFSGPFTGKFGRDTLVVAHSGIGVTQATLYGDSLALDLNATGAADRFVLSGTGAEAFIMDFRRAEGDRIDLTAYASAGIHKLADLSILPFSGSIETVSGPQVGVKVAIDETTFVVLVDHAVVIAKDFIFA